MKKKQPKVTPWFPGDVKPVHVGVYERNDNDATPTFQHWNGLAWGWAAILPKNAPSVSMRGKGVLQFECPWRGLTSKAAA